MCRIVALPPYFPKKKAMEIMKDFYFGNDDGTGSVYVKDDKFVVNKWNQSFEEVVKQKLPLFDHMPYAGWTLAHVRAASHGKNTYNNTHPFVKGNFAMVHNGVFHEYAPVKAALAATHKFKGETDSEVAAVLWNVIGRRKFIKTMESGVYMFLKRNGRVDVVCKSGGDLVFQNTKYGAVMASELPRTYGRQQTVLEGNFKLGRSGEIIRSNWAKDDAANWSWEYNYERADRKMLADLNRKGKKNVVKIENGFDHYPDEDEYADNMAAASRNGFVWAV